LTNGASKRGIPCVERTDPNGRTVCRAELRGKQSTEQYLESVGSDVSSKAHDRVIERGRAVALARHYREVEGLSTAEIARRLGRSPATIKAYFYDPS
jgi:DNA-binding NarL/FixJ family response regulator